MNNTSNLLLEILEPYSHLGRGFSQPRMYKKHDKALSLTVFKLVWDYVAGGAKLSTAIPNLLHFCLPAIRLLLPWSTSTIPL
jgi:hypothetical protein